MRYLILIFLTLTMPLTAFADDCQAHRKPGSGLSCIEGGVDNMLVEDAYAYPTSPNQKNGAVFMRIQNTGGETLRIVSADSDVAEKVELHTHIMDGDVMMMREVEHYDVPAHDSITLEPMGHHIMLIGLNRQLHNGEGFVLYLNTDDGQRYVLNIKIGQDSHEENPDS